MRKITFQKFAIALLTMGMLILLSSCDSAQKLDYYSQRENYINATGTISKIAYNENSTAIYIDFSELTPDFDDTCFKIVGDNLRIVQDNGIDEKMKIGDRVDFVAAPKYFGDGYVMPIVSISVYGDSLLEFEDGFTNLLSWLKSK